MIIIYCDCCCLHCYHVFLFWRKKTCIRLKMDVSYIDIVSRRKTFPRGKDRRYRGARLQHAGIYPGKADTSWFMHFSAHRLQNNTVWLHVLGQAWHQDQRSSTQNLVGFYLKHLVASKQDLACLCSGSVVVPLPCQSKCYFEKPTRPFSEARDLHSGENNDQLCDHVTFFFFLNRIDWCLTGVFRPAGNHAGAGPRSWPRNGQSERSGTENPISAGHQ